MHILPVAYIAPDKKYDDKYWALSADGDTLEDFASRIKAYIKTNIGNRIRQNDFAILNLPKSASEPDSNVMESYSGLAPYIGMIPLDEAEYLYLQASIAEDLPDVVGLSARPYSDIPLVSCEEGIFEFRAFMEQEFDAVEIITGVKLPKNLRWVPRRIH